MNPAIFACVTFPFFFGVMFGDVMHGSILFVTSIYLCLRKAPDAKHWSQPLHQARYFLLLSGLFATFCGLIYNDFTSVSMYLFGPSCWNLPAVGETVATPKPDCVYPIGIDPVWYMSTNEILFINSVKMKISLILGVL